MASTPVVVHSVQFGEQAGAAGTRLLRLNVTPAFPPPQGHPPDGNPGPVAAVSETAQQTMTARWRRSLLALYGCSPGCHWSRTHARLAKPARCCAHLLWKCVVPASEPLKNPKMVQAAWATWFVKDRGADSAPAEPLSLGTIAATPARAFCPIPRELAQEREFAVMRRRGDGKRSGRRENHARTSPSGLALAGSCWGEIDVLPCSRVSLQSCWGREVAL
jgi:hypothetical protein